MTTQNNWLTDKELAEMLNKQKTNQLKVLTLVAALLAFSVGLGYAARWREDCIKKSQEIKWDGSKYVCVKEKLA